MHRVALEALSKHLPVEVDLITMLRTLSLKLVNRTLDVSPCKWLRVCEQNVIALFKLRGQSELKGDTEALLSALVTDVAGNALPLLRIDRYASCLQLRILSMREDQVDRLVPIAQQLCLVALIHDAESKRSARLNPRLRRHAGDTEVKLCTRLTFDIR